MSLDTYGKLFSETEYYNLDEWTNCQIQGEEGVGNAQDLTA